MKICDGKKIHNNFCIEFLHIKETLKKTNSLTDSNAMREFLELKSYIKSALY